MIVETESLDGLTSANEVRDRVVAHIDRLNGAMFVMRQSHPLQFSGVVEFGPDGKLHRTVFVEGGAFGRAKVSATAVAIGPDGQPRSAVVAAAAPKTAPKVTIGALHVSNSKTTGSATSSEPSQ